VKNVQIAFHAAVVTSLAVALTMSLTAQQPASNSTDVQRQAMQKLSFLAGRWSGPITVNHGPGEPMRFTQTEDVEYKLDGLVVLIEGSSRTPDGKVMFNALATIAYDDFSKKYRIRAYNAGHYVDEELTVHPDGFSWELESGPAHVSNIMHLTAKSEWAETTDVAFGGNPAMRSMEMLLSHTH
jgi:hypothetical protein